MKKMLLSVFILFSVLAIAAQTVYITPKGKKYHSTKNCRTLSRSKNIMEVDISEVGNRTPCKVCY
ncbi:hypothetical protein IX317_001094 [Fusobacterium sp. DD29]|uniref:hypothetical protein n=1 Tax=unclassified Fusobacterium TaxID=2648384 RepID=UPI001B8D9EF3|nr:MULTISPECIES: hypothetical protein [unclassified Fusobacterium]MBR8701293.1 hypothetical protein [Fusobacterium sp. DD45]MBR8711091.1 hypothetical protein [Fusobacterium sp. DD28]MBR8749420.1 hypothetical protein [Fusobacterium sp. DD29]MBR8751665.1 hypothetical protein [Fusobacterium sp. DD26]MBR8761690.1 hypothetical protein [Fusobacterium sp. DD25]